MAVELTVSKIGGGQKSVCLGGGFRCPNASSLWFNLVPGGQRSR